MIDQIHAAASETPPAISIPIFKPRDLNSYHSPTSPQCNHPNGKFRIPYLLRFTPVPYSALSSQSRIPIYDPFPPKPNTMARLPGRRPSFVRRGASPLCSSRGPTRRSECRYRRDRRKPSCSSVGRVFRARVSATLPTINGRA